MIDGVVKEMLNDFEKLQTETDDSIFVFFCRRLINNEKYRFLFWRDTIRVDIDIAHVLISSASQADDEIQYIYRTLLIKPQGVALYPERSTVPNYARSLIIPDAIVGINIGGVDCYSPHHCLSLYS